MSFCVAIFALFFTVPNVFAQERRSVHFSHSLSDKKDQILPSSVFTRTLPETVHVLAVMVEFLPDNDSRTTGSGLLDTSTTAGQIIDPPPHDGVYFQNHLLFLHNYWRKVTNGSLIVVSDVVDTVVRLPHPMQFYSPPPSSATNRELAVLVHDVWRTVDTLRSMIDFSRYHAFCIFHAGVGRDIDLVSLLGFDPTPFDIPSVYVNLPVLQEVFGGSSQGVPVRDSSFFITNSMIVPETESRYLPSLGGQFFLQLGINGLLAASLGSHLGIPDLFDTRTGRSGIGRFGLMDGQSIFSWNGVFPPEPSAWEKVFLDRQYGLGMLHMIEALPGQAAYDLAAVGLSIVGRDTIGRVSITSKEYFLIENRNRDARRDSTVIWSVFNGTSIRQAFFRDTVGFEAFDQSRLYGVVVDVDEFDFSLPGGVTNAGEFFDGGILIWHIDENVIDAAYASNRVNADPDRKGVDLEEADGSQDIGQSYGFLDPGSGSESGTALDFWFSGNISPVYRNEFSTTSFPNSLSNNGANSHVTINGFSRRSPKMSINIQRGDSLVKPLSGYPKFVGKSRTDNSPQFFKALFVSAGDSVYAFRADSAVSSTPVPSGLFSTRGGQFPVVFVPSFSDTTIVVGVQDSSLYIWYAMDVNMDSVFDSIRTDQISVGARISTSPVVNIGVQGVPRSVVLYVGDEKGKLHRLSIDGSTRPVIDLVPAPVTSVALFSSTSGDSAIAVAGDILRKENGSAVTLPYVSRGWQVAAMEKGFVVVDVGGTTLLIVSRDLQILRHISVSDKLSPPAIGDIDADGRRDIVIGGGNRLYVINQTGAAVDYFPVTLPAPISGSPIIARLTPDKSQAQIIVTTINGLVMAYTNKGTMHPGFPLAAASANFSTPTVFALPMGPLLGDVPALFLTDGSGYLSGWQLQFVRFGLPPPPWGSYRGNVFHTGSDTSLLIPSPPSVDFFPAYRAYNWPNPVYDGKTFIRYFVRENSTVQIKIFDLAGELIDELTGPGIGELDNEIEWNASNVQSGVYFCRIEAQAGGNNGTAIIKIAVVK